MNLEDMGVLQGFPHGAGMGHVRVYPDDDCLHRISGSNFRGFEGTLDLLHHTSAAKQPVPSLLDLARMAVDSNRHLKGIPSLGGNFKNVDFQYPTVEDLWQCRCTMLPELDSRFFRLKVCLLCDSVAELLGGKTVQDGSSLVWGFSSQKEAQMHFLLCVIVTCGTSSFYCELHKRARRKFLMFLGLTQNMHGRKFPKTSTSRDRNNADGPFVYAAISGGNGYSGPFFYVIGNRNNDSTENTSRTTQVMHDFCLVLPDIQFYNMHKSRLEGSSKLRKADGKGRALYIRPLQAFAGPGIQRAVV